MADGNLDVIPALRLASPVLRDFAYIAERMRADEIEQFLALTGSDTYRADTCARAMAYSQGPTWSLIDRHGYVALVGGFDPLRPGVFECWLAGTDAGWLLYGSSFTRICRRLMADLFAQGAHRIQTCALTSRTQAHRWYERGVGMRSEGVQRGYFADGQDGIMYAATRIQK